MAVSKALLYIARMAQSLERVEREGEKWRVYMSVEGGVVMRT
jgi:hypothetical protein